MQQLARRPFYPDSHFTLATFVQHRNKVDKLGTNK